MFKFFLVLAFSFASLSPGCWASEGLVETMPASAIDFKNCRYVHLTLLNKITARKTHHVLKIGDVQRCDKLSIQAHRIIRLLPEYHGCAAFLTIQDPRHQQGDRLVFKNWMFSKHPSISTLEHATYDLWITGVQDTPQQGTDDTQTAPQGDDAANDGEYTTPHLPAGDQSDQGTQEKELRNLIDGLLEK